MRAVTLIEDANMRNRYFIDTEFHEDGKCIDLISIGVVCGDGRTYYAVNREFNKVNLFDNPWLVEHVLPHLPVVKYKPNEPWSWANICEDFSDPAWKTRKQIRDDLEAFIMLSVPSTDNDELLTVQKPQIWGYYADYDWIAVCQLFGTMMDLPGGWPKVCLDLKQLGDMLGIINFPQPAPDIEHHALSDAQWNYESFLYARHIVTNQGDQVTAGFLEHFLGL